MINPKTKILGISSLRPVSSAGAILKLWLTSSRRVDLQYTAVSRKIKAFDDSRPLPLPVVDFIRQITAAMRWSFVFGICFWSAGALKCWTGPYPPGFFRKTHSAHHGSVNGKRRMQRCPHPGCIGNRISEETKLLVFKKTKLDEGGQVTDQI